MVKHSAHNRLTIGSNPVGSTIYYYILKGDLMKTIKIDLSKKLNSLEIIPLADLHIGDPLCDMALIQEKIEYIKNNENVYCLLNGDLMNNSTKNSVGDVYGEKLTPMEQLAKVCVLFEPIKEKILAVTNGNHEFRSYKWDGVDLMKLFCLQLGIEDKYANESALIFLRFGDQGTHNRHLPVPYVLFVTHGSGGGRKEGAKAIRLADMANIVDADIYIHSHTHLPMIMKQSFYRVDTRSSSVLQVPKLFINTAAMLNYGGYGEAAEFKPTSKETPHLFLDGKAKQFKAKL